MIQKLKNGISSIGSIVRWYVNHRRNGLPIERRDDSDYVDWFYNFRPHLKKFEDIHKGEDCFIIGNGPSIGKMDLSVLNNFHVFGLNKIHLIFEKYALALDYHVAVNPLVIEQTYHQLSNGTYGCPSFLSYHASKGFTYSSKSVHRLLTNGKWSFYRKITDQMCEGYTVTYVAMQIAFYMGFQRVFLIGVDHSFKQEGKANEKQIYAGDDQNHFHPDYFKGMAWHTADIEGNEASYALAKHQFHAAGREIFDATVNGKLTIFEKIDFDLALQMAKSKNSSKDKDG